MEINPFFHLMIPHCHFLERSCAKTFLKLQQQHPSDQFCILRFIHIIVRSISMSEIQEYRSSKFILEFGVKAAAAEAFVATLLASHSTLHPSASFLAISLQQKRNATFPF
jgi:hypothetical protein